jgi:hypothetical protein
MHCRGVAEKRSYVNSAPSAPPQDFSEGYHSVDTKCLQIYFDRASDSKREREEALEYPPILRTMQEM